MTESLRFPAFPTVSGAFPEDPGTVSREEPESGDRFPATVSPFPDVSDRFPPRFPASGTESVLPRPALSISGTRETVRLATWLEDLKARDLTIATGPDGPTIGGHNLHLVTPDDTHQLAWHRHALELAAAGTHPAWWNHVLGRTPTLDVDDMPTVPDPRDQLTGDGWPCACCGTPADLVTPDGLPWCQEHA